jgi:DNA-binding LacI/PurR family transcriptional regulator
MEVEKAKSLKKGLSEIKKDVNSKIGNISKLKKNQIISKIKSLNYKYNANTRTLTTDSMIRKKRKIKLV